MPPIPPIAAPISVSCSSLALRCASLTAAITRSSNNSTSFGINGTGIDFYGGNRAVTRSGCGHQAAARAAGNR